MKPTIDRKRHLLKTLTWRIVGTIDTIILSWAISGDPFVGLSIGGAEVVTKMLLYYFHERAWYRFTDFGVKKSKKLKKDSKKT
jgi:uncharacterized membrane protein